MWSGGMPILTQVRPDVLPHTDIIVGRLPVRLDVVVASAVLERDDGVAAAADGVRLIVSSRCLADTMV